MSTFSLGGGIVYDLVALGVLGVAVFCYFRLGFLAGFVELVGNAVSLVLAWLVSQRASPLIFAGFLRSVLEEKLTDVLAQNGMDVGQSLAQSLSFLPLSIRQAVVDKAGEILDLSVPQGATVVVTQVLEPLLTPIIAVLLFFIIYLVARFLVALLSKILQSICHMPVLGGVNRTMGAVLGLAAGSLYVFLMFCAVWALMLVTGGQLPFLNETVLGESLGYTLFQTVNPFV